MAKRENTQKKKKERKITAERHRETKKEEAAATQKQLAKTQARLPPSCCRPNVLENFLLHEVITTLRKERFSFAVHRNLRQLREVCYTFL